MICDGFIVPWSVSSRRTVMSVIERRIRQGDYLLNPIPGERKIAEETGVSHMTARKAVRRVPVLEQAGIMSGWAGLRPLTPDEHAIIDYLPSVAGVLCAVGFCGHGFQHSPAAGRVVAEMILDGKPALDISALSFARFQSTMSRPPRGKVPEPD